MCCLSVCACVPPNQPHAYSSTPSQVSSEDQPVIMTSGVRDNPWWWWWFVWVACPGCYYVCSQFSPISQSDSLPLLLACPAPLSPATSFPPPTSIQLLPYCYFLSRRLYGLPGRVCSLLLWQGERGPVGRLRWLHPPASKRSFASGAISYSNRRCHSDARSPSEARWTIRKSWKTGLLMKDV